MVYNRGIFSILLMFVVVAGVGGGLLSLNRVEKQQQHYKQHTEMLEISYRAAIHAYKIATEIYLRDTIRQPEVLSLFAPAWRSDEAGKANLRHRLYNKLQGSYQELWQHRLRQLHFQIGRASCRERV